MDRDDDLSVDGVLALSQTEEIEMKNALEWMYGTRGYVST